MRWTVFAVALGAAATSVAWARSGFASGLTAPVGPTGCEGGNKSDDEAPRLWTATVSLALAGADVRFDDDNYDLQQYAATAALGRRFADRTTVRFAAGSVVVGGLSGEGREYLVKPGPLLSASVAYRFLGPPENLPFITLSLSFGASFARTAEHGVLGGEEQSLTATDGRFGLLFGKTFGNAFSPYVGARVFGGPIFWRRMGEDRIGSDREHYALAAGMSFSTRRGFGLLIDLAFLGEASLTLAISYSF